MLSRAWLAVVVIACACSEAHPDVPLLDAAPDALVCNVAHTTQCNPLTQTACAPFEQCTWAKELGAPEIGHLQCKSSGSQPIGSACAYSDGPCFSTDSCVPGAVCASGLCRRICDINGAVPSPCVGAEACVEEPGLFSYGGNVFAGVCK